VLAVTKDGVAALVKEAAAVEWVQNAFVHLKFIGHTAAAKPLMDKASVVPDAGVIAIEGGIAAFIKGAKTHRLWEREPTLRTPG